MPKALTPLALTIAGTLATTANAAVPTYGDFEVQVRSGEVGFNIPGFVGISNSQPVINNNSQVALRAFTPGAMSVWFGANGSGSLIHQTSDTEAIISNLDMNDQGYLVWSETFGNNAPGVWQWTQLAGASYRTNRPLGTSAWTALEVDNSRTLGLRASFSGANVFTTLTTANDQTVYTESTGTDPSSPWDFLFTPSFNNNLQIAAKVRRVGSGNEIRIFNADGTNTLIAEDSGIDPGSPYSSFRNSGDLNDDGWFAFAADLVGGGDGVYISNGTTTLEIANTNTNPDLNEVEFFAPRVNNNGVVTFRGFDGDGDRSVFVGDGTTFIKLVTEDDIVMTDLGPLAINRLDGAPAFGSSPDINDLGEVVFSCSVNDGVQDIGSAVVVAKVIKAPDCPGDTDGNQMIDLADLNIVLANFGTTTTTGDVTGDGNVDLADLNLILGAFGFDCTE